LAVLEVAPVGGKVCPVRRTVWLLSRVRVVASSDGAVGER